jgi:DNA-binding YbaB/EbfC family protein
MSKGFDLGGLFKQAQELQGRLAAAQQSIGERSVDGSAGGGMVTVRVSGKLELQSVHIDPTLLESPDRDMLQESTCRRTRWSSRCSSNRTAWGTCSSR